MRVQFTYTQDDLVDASMRFLSRSRTIRRWRWTELGWTVFLTWTIVFMIFRSAMFMAVLAASAAAMIAVLLVAAFQPAVMRRRIRKIIKERHGDEDESLCEVEITPETVRTQEHAIQTTLDWRDVEEVCATADSVDIFGRPSGVIIRDRAFSSPDEKRQFVALAESYLAAARHGTK